MNKKSQHQATEKKPERDLASFDRLPEETKKLMKLKEQDEKAVGPEELVINKEIEEEASKTQP